MNTNSAEQNLQFLHKLQVLLDGGSYTSTYKFALLHALADLSVEKEPDSEGILRLRSFDIANKVIDYYWRQAVPFTGVGQTDVLMQNRQGQAEIVTSLQVIREQNVGYEQFTGNAVFYDSVREDVAKTIGEWPLPRLQKLRGNKASEFLYMPVEFKRSDWVLSLYPGVAESFSTMHALIINMIRGAWVKQVQNFTANSPLLGPDSRLFDFMFGSVRSNLDPYRRILLGFQNNECFYCSRDVSSESHVDHFIPWSRYPTDLGHNFVLACRPCNGAKKDHLASAAHLAKWREVNLDGAESLAIQFDENALYHDSDASKQVAFWAYRSVESGGGLVWKKGREMEYLSSNWKSSLGV